MSAPTYTNDAQQRILRLLTVLADHPVVGMTNAAVALALSCSRSVATRDLSNLIEAGFAEHVPENGTFRLSPHIVQISFRHAAAVEDAERGLSQLKTRFTRS
jgi:DNA-binding IclR family transcriptional regulator